MCGIFHWTARTFRTSVAQMAQSSQKFRGHGSPACISAGRTASKRRRWAASMRSAWLSHVLCSWCSARPAYVSLQRLAKNSPSKARPLPSRLLSVSGHSRSSSVSFYCSSAASLDRGVAVLLRDVALVPAAAAAAAEEGNSYYDLKFYSR